MDQYNITRFQLPFIISEILTKKEFYMINERNVSLLTSSRTWECTNKYTDFFVLKKRHINNMCKNIDKYSIIILIKCMNSY